MSIFTESLYINTDTILVHTYLSYNQCCKWPPLACRHTPTLQIFFADKRQFNQTDVPDEICGAYDDLLCKLRFSFLPADYIQVCEIRRTWRPKYLLTSFSPGTNGAVAPWKRDLGVQWRRPLSSSSVQFRP
jgi:hypothetical protein